MKTHDQRTAPGAPIKCPMNSRVVIPRGTGVSALRSIQVPTTRAEAKLQPETAEAQVRNVRSSALKTRKRLKWIQSYEKLANGGTVCLKYGISTPSLRKWLRRYERDGLSGLKNESRRPHSSPPRKTPRRLETLIFRLTRQRKSGVKMTCSELLHLHGVSLSVARIHKVLALHNVDPLPIGDTPTAR